MTPLAVRCSSLPTACACPQAVRPPAVKIDTADASARVGTAVHACLAGRISGEAPENDVQLAAAANDVDPDDVGHLVYLGWKYWRERLAELFPDPEVELPLEGEPIPGIRITGHADVFSVVEVEQIRICDFKTGWADGSHEAQLRGYALLGLLRHPDATSVWACVVRLREGTIDGYLWSRAEVFAWFERHLQAWQKEDAPYKPGAACGWCWRSRECPAHAEALAHSVSLFSPVDGSAVATRVLDLAQPVLPLSPATVLDAYRHLQAVAKVCDDAREAIRAHVEAAGGRIADGERELVLLPQARREVVPSHRTVNELAHLLGSWQPLYDAMKLSLTKLEGAAREQAPRGQKKEAALALVEMLDALGALVTTSAQRLTLRRVTPLIKTGETPNGNGNTGHTAASTDQR